VQQRNAGDEEAGARKTRGTLDAGPLLALDSNVLAAMARNLCFSDPSLKAANRPTGPSTMEDLNVTHRSSLALFATALLLAAPVFAQVTDAKVAAVAPTGAVETPLYTVVDGDKVDPNSMKGWRTWRAMACERCHGPNQEGLVGPSLVNSLKVLTKEQFKQTLMNGRPRRVCRTLAASRPLSTTSTTSTRT
jgi:hypothetical protein